MLREDLFAAQILRLVCETVVAGLLVDEDLMVEEEVALGREQARWKNVAAVRLDSDEYVGSAQRAEAPLRPRGGIEDSDFVLTIDAEVVSAAQCEERSSTPLPAYVAVAGSGICSQLLRPDRHRPAKTTSIGLDASHRSTPVPVLCLLAPLGILDRGEPSTVKSASFEVG